jgi:hypothetical protein
VAYLGVLRYGVFSVWGNLAMAAFVIRTLLVFGKSTILVIYYKDIISIRGINSIWDSGLMEYDGMGYMGQIYL